MRIFPVLLLALLVFANLAAFAAEKMTAPELISLAQAHSASLTAGINATFTPKELQEGTAWAGKGHDFFFALQSATPPTLFIDGAPGPQMQPLSPGGLWYAVARIEELGVLHSFEYQ